MRRSLTAGAAFAVFLAVILTNLPFWTSPRLREQGDLAANALQVERAREFRELLGPYSRLGFHHPGPISFYGQAFSEPFFFFLPSPLARHSAFQLGLSLLLAAWAVRLLRRAGSMEAPLTTAAFFLLLAPLLFLAGGGPIMLASLWGPTLVVYPVVLFVVAAAGVAAGDRRSWPAAALGATIAWHNHLPTLPALAVVGAGAAVLAAAARHGGHRAATAGGDGGTATNGSGDGAASGGGRPPDASRARAGRGGRWTLWATVLILAAGLLPPLCEELANRPGNLTLIARFLRDNPPGHHSWAQVMGQLGPAFTDPLVFCLKFTGVTWRSPPIALAIITGLCAVSSIQFRRSARPWQLVVALTWTAVLITFIAARYAHGELHTYLFYYLYGLVGLLNLFVAKEIWDRWLRARLSPPGRVGVAAAVMVAALGIGLLVALLVGHRIPPAGRDDCAEIVRDLGVPAVHLERGQGPRDGDLWQKVPALALCLRRAGVRVTVSEPDILLCGEEMRPRPDEPPAPTLLITREGQPGTKNVMKSIHAGDWGVHLLSPAGERQPG